MLFIFSSYTLQKALICNWKGLTLLQYVQKRSVEGHNYIRLRFSAANVILGKSLNCMSYKYRKYHE